MTTKREKFETLRTILDGETYNADTIEELREFVDAELDALDRKAELARARTQKKVEEGNKLRERVYATLSTSKFMTTIEIVNALKEEFEDITPGKVTARLTQLFNMNMIEKDDISVGESRYVKGYRAISDGEE